MKNLNSVFRALGIVLLFGGLVCGTTLAMQKNEGQLLLWEEKKPSFLIVALVFSFSNKSFKSLRERCSCTNLLVNKRNDLKIVGGGERNSQSKVGRKIDGLIKSVVGELRGDGHTNFIIVTFNEDSFLKNNATEKLFECTDSEKLVKKVCVTAYSDKELEELKQELKNVENVYFFMVLEQDALSLYPREDRNYEGEPFYTCCLEGRGDYYVKIDNCFPDIANLIKLFKQAWSNCLSKNDEEGCGSDDKVDVGLD